MNIQDMLNPPANAEDLDARLEVASAMLEKAAAAEGIDLNSLTNDEMSGLLLEIMGKEASEGAEGGDAGGEGGDAEPAAAGSETAEGSDGPSVVEVFSEVQKRAAAEGVDLTKLSSEELALVINGVSEEMSAPDYSEKLAEAQEWERSKAAMRELGEEAADAFIGRVNSRLKLAGDDEPKDDKKEKDEKSNPFAKGDKGDDDKDDGKKEASAKERLAGAVANLKSHAGKAGDHIKNHKATRAVDRGVQRAGEKVLNTVGAGGEKASPSLKRRAAGATAGAAAVGAAGGAAAARGRDKKASFIDEEGLKLARQILIDNGIDPDTGAEVKLASDEEIQARALEILGEAGYEV